MRIIPLRIGLAVALAAVTAFAATSQEMTWFDDYDAALKEAKRIGRPLLVFFETPRSAHSIEETTTQYSSSLDFRASARRFVLARVKSAAIDRTESLDWYAGQEPSAAAIVDPAGKPVSRWKEPGSPEGLARQMDDVLSSLLLESAAEAVKSEDDRTAVGLYWEVIAVRPEFELLGRARRGLAEANRRGKMKVWEVEEEITRREYLEAKKRLAELAKDYAGTDAGRAAAERIEEMRRDTVVAAALRMQELDEEASNLLVQARRLYEEGDGEGARAVYVRLVEDYAGTSYAEEAAGEIADVERELLEEATASRKKMDEDCRRWMSYGDTLADQDMRTKAISYYEKIIDAYPESGYAEIAREKIRKAQ